jgi:hypothetical protein
MAAYGQKQTFERGGASGEAAASAQAWAWPCGRGYVCMCNRIGVPIPGRQEMLSHVPGY